ncbi:MAG: ComF family protein [Clostridia bacterium]|nr:ComF family protein [Clostridia bacterium]
MFSLKTYRCCGCGKVFYRDAAQYVYNSSCICKTCSAALPCTTGKRRFFGDYYNDYTYSPFYYEGLYRSIFLSFKFHGDLSFGHILGMAAGDELKGIDELCGYDTVVPVPLSKERSNERGYNQSEIMAGYIADALGIPLCNYLTRIKNGPPQSTAVGVERTNVLLGAFIASGDAAGKRIILFDDIHTTGSTLHECELTLRNAGARDVCPVTAAYVYRGSGNNIY